VNQPVASEHAQPPPYGYIGIDFGTSNTHISFCYVDGKIGPQSIQLGGRDSAMTCLLWKEPAEGNEDVVAYGDRALQTWSVLSDEARATCRFAVGFKPDIAARGQRAAIAQRDARAFLRKCCLELREGGVLEKVGSMEGMPVVIGVPAEVGAEQKDLTAQLASAAGFGETIPVEEPLGALAFHLNDGTVTASEARRGVVVVDFGGGTLDIAWLDARYGVRMPWGDPTLGGRLFDDLFYTWLLDQNPGLELNSRDHAYVWQASCRELKERFSSHWSLESRDAKGGERKPPAQISRFEYAFLLPGKKVVGFSGSVPEFLERASRYVPSNIAAAYFSTVGGRLAQMGRSGPEDLIGLVRRELSRGMAGHPRGTARVILTGGSSRWPFMADLAVEAFGVARANVRTSAQPETTVGSGLALYHVLKVKNGKKREKLRDELPIYRREFEAAAEEIISGFSEELAVAAVAPLVEQTERVYLDWYRKGGTLREVKEKVERLASEFDLSAPLQGKYVLLAKTLVRVLRDHLGKWLAEHEIPRNAEEVIPDGAVDVSAPTIRAQAQEIAKIVADTVGVTLVGAVFLIVYAAAHGTHIFVHPLTGVPMAAASAVAAYMGWTKVEDWMREQVMQFPWTTHTLGILSVRLSEQGLRDMIANGRLEAIDRVATILRTGRDPFSKPGRADRTTPAGQWRTLDELKATVASQFEEAARDVINELGVLEEIRDIRT
jgi:molecular chaperone DnaK